MPIQAFEGSEAWRSLARAQSGRWGDIAARFGQDPFRIDHRPKFELPLETAFFCLGSCFARNVEEHLIYRGAEVLSKRVVSPRDEWQFRPNGFVNKFTSHSMLQEVRWLEQPPADLAGHLTETANGWRDLHLAPGLGHSTLERALERRRYLSQDYFPRLRQAGAVLLTLGLNEVWFDHEMHTHLNAAPDAWAARRAPGRFSLEVTDAAENLAALNELRERLKALNPDMKIVVTVSPVPMQATFSGRDIAVANTLSKSTLRAAADAFQAQHPDVDYFPSYEIVTLTSRPYAYAADQLHVTDLVVGHAMGQFLEAYCPNAPAIADDFVEFLYLDANPDVEDSVRAGELASGHEHWISIGKAEGRPLREAVISERARLAGI